MRLRLSHKGLMLVSAVLLFELVLVASFAGMLDRSGQELDHSYLAEAVMAHIDSLRRVLMEAECHAGLPGNGNARAATAANYELNALRFLLREDPEGLTALDGVDRTVNDELRRLNSIAINRAITASLPAFDYAGVDTFSTRLSDQLDRVAFNYRRPLEFVADRVTLSRRMTQNNIFFIVLINAVIAVATTLFFMQGIVNRLRTVADNSLRFDRGEELNPPIEGTDEIAALDRLLHDTLKRRQEVEKLLKESEARTRSLIENMPVGVVTIDIEGNVESINPETERIFGYTFDEIVGDHLSALFTITEMRDGGLENPILTPSSTSRGAFVESLCQKTLGRSARFESRRKNGEFFPVELTLTEYLSVDGKRYLAIIEDITERVRAEQFRQELIAMVSHDLRSPLTSVQGVMTLLGRGMYGQLNETGEKRVKVAEQSLSRLIHLVDDILDLERMEAGKLQFNPESVPISSVIDRSIESVYDYGNQQQIKFDTSIGEFDVYVDEDRLVQVVVNLLGNAIKFSPSGGTIAVSTADAGEFVEVRVKDQGPGIPEQHQEEIFQRFHQLESIRSTKGTGLGLAIAKAIIDGHEGAIGVSSEVGIGSTFWFRVRKQAKIVDPGPAVTEQKTSGVGV